MIDKEVINEYVTDMTKYYASTHNGEIPSQFEKYLRKAVEKGLELSKIKWHDLRKDPNDLPVRRCIDNDGNVVRLFHNSWDKKLTWYRYDFHECEWWQMETEPIAWCEIPKYTEE